MLAMPFSRFAPSPGDCLEHYVVAMANEPAQVSRWTHDAINSNMIFGSGRAGGASVYSLVGSQWAESWDHLGGLETYIVAKLGSYGTKILRLFLQLMVVWTLAS